MTSIRRRLLAFLLALLAAAWALLAVLSYQSAAHEVEELFDAELAQSARVLFGLTLHELEEEDDPGESHPDVIGSKPGHDYEEKIAFQIWKGERLLFRSRNAPEGVLAEHPGYDDRELGESHWRVFALHDAQHDVRVMVGQRHDVRDELAGYIIQNLLWPVVLLLPLAALFIWTGVGGGLAPLKRLAAEIGRRSPQQLEPLDRGGVPLEVQPIVDSLNGLLARLDEALEGERRFTANAAHELRTPLAALKTQAQVALRAVTDAERKQTLEQIVRGVDRATHLVGQLLTLARLDPQTAAASHSAVDLAQIAAAVVGELAPAALDKNMEIGLAEHAVGAVQGETADAPSLARGPRLGPIGDPAALAILLRNLVDNAIHYTPEGGRVEVSVRGDDGGVELSVRDSGPGIPAGERAHIFERFYRLPGSPGSGCGLGLSIVHRIAELHDARVELGEGLQGRGLSVIVRFPRVPGR